MLLRQPSEAPRAPLPLLPPLPSPKRPSTRSCACASHFRERSSRSRMFPIQRSPTGSSVAIDPSGSQVVAPAAGVVSQAFPTGHAVALTLDDGAEVLIHVGLDTVKMNGEGFTLHVKNGDRVVAGQPLVDFDRAKIEAAGYKAITPVVILGHADSTIEFV